MLTHQGAHHSVILKCPQSPRTRPCRAVPVSIITPDMTNNLSLHHIQLTLMWSTLLPQTPTNMVGPVLNHHASQPPSQWKPLLQLSLNPEKPQTQSSILRWWCLEWELTGKKHWESLDCLKSKTDERQKSACVNAVLRKSSRLPSA